MENIRQLASGRVRFDVRLSRSESERRVTVEAPVARRGRVRASNGQVETRIFVLIGLRIGPVLRKVELSLVDRGQMIFRMLIGRRALAHAFLVDPSRRYVLKQTALAEPVTPKVTPRKSARARLAP